MSENIIMNETKIPACIRNESLRNLMLNGNNTQSYDRFRSSRGNHNRLLGKSLAYVTNFLDFSVSVIDIRFGQEIDRIPIENFAYGIDINPAGDIAYVTNFPLGSLTLISIPDHTVITVIDLNTPPLNALGSTDVKVSTDGRYVYVANATTNNISVVNASRREVIIEIPLAGSPQQIAITPNGNLAYVTLQDLNLIAVIDLNTSSVLKYIPAGSNPIGIDISPVFPIGLVANQVSNNLSTFNTQLAESSATFIDVGTAPTDVVFHPRCTFAYVTNQLSNDISAVDVFVRREVERVPVGTAPIGIDITDDSQYLVVCNALSNTVSIIDRRTLAQQTVAVGLVPLYVKVLETTRKCSPPKK